MKRSNRLNRLTYGCWAPIYDGFVEAPMIARARRQAFGLLDLDASNEVLLVGVGTGADLKLLPPGIVGAGVDLSPAMLAQAKKKLPSTDGRISLVEADAQRLPFMDASFDTAILTLILSVVPDPGQCLRETLRVVRPGGRLLVFDKFLADNRSPSGFRRLLNLLTSVFGTDINRRLGDTTEGLDLTVVTDRASLFRGAYRGILLEKTRSRAEGDEH